MEISNQVVLAAVVAYAIQFIKNSRFFPFITTETAKLNRALAVVLSGLSALGIHVVCSKVNHSCTLTWVDGMTIVTVLWHWVGQFVLQHGWYKAIIAPGSK